MRLELGGDGSALVNGERTELPACSRRIEELLGKESGRPERLSISVNVDAEAPFSTFVNALWMQLQHDAYALDCVWQAQSGGDRVRFEIYPCDVHGCRDRAEGAPGGGRGGSSPVVSAPSVVFRIVQGNEVRTPPDAVGAHVLKRAGTAGDVLLNVPESVPASYVLDVVRSCALAGAPLVSIAPARSKGEDGRLLSVKEKHRSGTILAEGEASPSADNVVGVHVTVFATQFKPAIR